MTTTRFRVCTMAAAKAVLVLALLWPALAAAQSRPAFIVLFDGSGSMWGRLGPGPQSKLVAAREALAETLIKSPPEVPAGLVSFGRNRGDCADVELVAPLEAGDRQRILAPLERLNPRGRGPLTLALRTAAKALEGHEGPRHILVIHDEPDNCSLDPCATATELKAADARLTVSTVTLGGLPDDVRLMACLARSTGGRALVADTPQDAKTAIATAVDFAAGDVRQPASTSGLLAGPRQASRAGGPPRVRLTASLGPSGPVLTEGVEWRIWPATGRDGPTVAESKRATPDIALEPGRYVIEAKAGLARASTDVEVAASGVTPLKLALDAGRIDPRVVFKRGEQADPNAEVALFTSSGSADATKTAIWIGHPAPLVVPPGTYALVATEGRSRATQQITVATGQTRAMELSLDAGRLALSATTPEGSPAAAGVTYRILEADPDAEGGFREVARTAASAPDFVLPAGSYQVIARQGTSELRTRIAVTAGDALRHTFNLQAARVVARVALSGAPELGERTFSVLLTPLDQPEAETVEIAGNEAEFVVPPGRYRVEGRAGALHGKAVRDIELRAGVDERVALTVPAARIELQVADPIASLALAETFWEILDAADRVVWRTVEHRPTGILPAGRYKARLTLRSRAIEKPFVVVAGVPSTVIVGDERQ